MNTTKLLLAAGLMTLMVGCAATGNMVGKIADVVPWGGEDEAIAQTETADTQSATAMMETANVSQMNDVDAQMMDAMASTDMASADEAEAPAPYAPIETEAHEHTGSKY